jgi:hypothetical protein
LQKQKERAPSRSDERKRSEYQDDSAKAEAVSEEKIWQKKKNERRSNLAKAEVTSAEQIW